MSDGSSPKTGWSAGKIILMIAGILIGLVVLCCVAGYFVAGDQIKAGMKFGMDMAAFQKKIETDLGEGAVAVPQNDMLMIGLKENPSPERVVEVQDLAWKSFANHFRENGFIPVNTVAVGTVVKSGGNARVKNWEKNIVTVDELIQRTGVPAPPLVKFLPPEFAEKNVKINVEVNSDDEDDSEDGTEQDGKEEDEGGGAGGK
jgi:hypothetical protein